MTISGRSTAPRAAGADAFAASIGPTMSLAQRYSAALNPEQDVPTSTRMEGSRKQGNTALPLAETKP